MMQKNDKKKTDVRIELRSCLLEGDGQSLYTHACRHASAREKNVKKLKKKSRINYLLIAFQQDPDICN